MLWIINLQEPNIVFSSILFYVFTCTFHSQLLFQFIRVGFVLLYVYDVRMFPLWSMIYSIPSSFMWYHLELPWISKTFCHNHPPHCLTLLHYSSILLHSILLFIIYPSMLSVLILLILHNVIKCSGSPHCSFLKSYHASLKLITYYTMVFFLKRSMFRLIWWSVNETESGTSDQVTVIRIYHNHNMWIHAQVHGVLIKHCILSCILYFCQCLHMVLCVDFNRSPRHLDKYLIKRIVGLEGDIVQ